MRGSVGSEKKLIELQGVSKTVASGNHSSTILQPTDLSVAAGEFVSIIGPSGSGKSTLLGLIAGLDVPSSGYVFVDSVDVTNLDENRLAKFRGENIGFVFQFFHLIPSLKAIENIAVPLEIAGDRDAFKKGRELLNEVGLQERGEHYPWQLSGGEQQRVAIARALANNPEVLLADEPTGNLDSRSGGQVVDLLLKVNKMLGTTIVMVTHDSELTSRSSRVLKMRDGRLEVS